MRRWVGGITRSVACCYSSFVGDSVMRHNVMSRISTISRPTSVMEREVGIRKCCDEDDDVSGAQCPWPESHRYATINMSFPMLDPPTS